MPLPPPHAVAPTPGMDPWLRGNQSCPLCRAPSRCPTRRSNPDAATAAVRAYPLPSDLPNSALSEYLVEEEVQVVLKRSSRARMPPSGPVIRRASRISNRSGAQSAVVVDRGPDPDGVVQVDDGALEQ
jgi:E3 ubiquitin-protein ligase ATL4